MHRNNTVFVFTNTYIMSVFLYCSISFLFFSVMKITLKVAIFIDQSNIYLTFESDANLVFTVHLHDELSVASLSVVHGLLLKGNESCHILYELKILILMCRFGLLCDGVRRPAFKHHSDLITVQYQLCIWTFIF